MQSDWIVLTYRIPALMINLVTMQTDVTRIYK